MGVGQPSKISTEELTRVDLDIPTSFAKASKAAGCVRHISLLSSVGADPEQKPSRWTGTTAGGGLYLGLKGKVRTVKVKGEDWQTCYSVVNRQHFGANIEILKTIGTLFVCLCGRPRVLKREMGWDTVVSGLVSTSSCRRGRGGVNCFR